MVRLAESPGEASFLWGDGKMFTLCVQKKTGQLHKRLIMMYGGARLISFNVRGYAP
jgi:hypothetical protein